jgi:hypothetical protein
MSAAAGAGTGSTSAYNMAYSAAYSVLKDEFLNYPGAIAAAIAAVFPGNQARHVSVVEKATRRIDSIIKPRDKSFNPFEGKTYDEIAKYIAAEISDEVTSPVTGVQPPRPPRTRGGRRPNRRTHKHRTYKRKCTMRQRK